MDIIVAGAGKVGYTVAAQLCAEGHSVTVIDRLPERIELVSGSLDVSAICGDADIETLKMAGASRAELLIAVMDSDEANILCCMTARKLGVKQTAARVRTPERTRDVGLLRSELGLMMTVNPDLAAAREISRVLRFPSATMVEPFARGLAELVEFTVGADNPLCGLCLRDFHAKFGKGILIGCVRRGEDIAIPSGDFVLQQGDTVHVLGAPKEIHGFFKAMAIYKKAVRSVMILGGGHTGRYLAAQLLDMGLRVKIVEADAERCDECRDDLKKAEIVCGNGAKPDLLLEEGIAETDAFVALTGSDEINLIMAAWAKSQNVGKVVCKVNEAHFLSLAASFGLEKPVRPSDIAAQQLLRAVRGMENSAHVSGVESLRRIVDGKIEALEFIARRDFPALGVTLSDMPVKKGVLAAAIIRGSKCFIPGGRDCIEEGDRVIVLSEQAGLCELGDILKG